MSIPTAIVRRIVRTAGCVCAALLASLVALPAQGQLPRPPTTQRMTPPPRPGAPNLPQRGYPATRYPGGDRLRYPGGPAGRPYDARYRDPRTGRFTQGRYGRGMPTPPGRYGRTPPRGRATPTPRGTTPKASPGKGPASTRSGQPATTIRGRRPTPIPRGRSSKAAAVTARFTFKPLPDVAVLYITPLRAEIAVAEEFETVVSLSNPGEKEFQTIEVALRFDPAALEPVRLDDDEIHPLLEGDSEAVVYTEAGVLFYRARLAQPLASQAAEFFTVRWKTLGVSPHTEVTFSAWRELRTALLDESEQNILGGTGSGGSLGMTLQVFSPEARADGPPIGDELFAGSHERARGGVRLRLFANKKTIPASEDFYIGVWFENPGLVEISKVAFKIRFDPHVLEVVDDDTNNWIATGVNIFDGDYHGLFPFDIHVENSVLNGLGLITYAMASTQRRALPERGYIARIRFRPKALAASTPIEFTFEPDDDPFRTQVSFLGGDVLGEPDQAGDGVEDVAIRIVEPELPRLLATEE